VRHWVGRTLKELLEAIPNEWLRIVEEVRQLLNVLHPDGRERFHTLWKQLPQCCSRPGQERSAMQQSRDLLVRLNRGWHTYCTLQSELDVSWKNNAPECAIVPEKYAITNPGKACNRV
jgi:hypothetical protein